MSDRETLNDETLAMLLETGRRMKQQLDKLGAGHDTRLAELVMRHSKAVAMFSAEHRKASDGIEKAAAATSQEERIAIAERWLARLPPELLRPVVERLKAGVRKRG